MLSMLLPTGVLIVDRFSSCESRSQYGKWRSDARQKLTSPVYRYPLDVIKTRVSVYASPIILSRPR